MLADCAQLDPMETALTRKRFAGECPCRMRAEADRSWFVSRGCAAPVELS